MIKIYRFIEKVEPICLRNTLMYLSDIYGSIASTQVDKDKNKVKVTFMRKLSRIDIQNIIKELTPQGCYISKYLPVMDLDYKYIYILDAVYTEVRTILSYRNKWR